jgi:hypothetical protein
LHEPGHCRGLESRRPQHAVRLLPGPTAERNDPARRRRALQDNKFWATPAGKPRLGRDGVQMTDPTTGKPLWSPIVAFETKQIGDRFSAQVVEALRLTFPTALPQPGEALLEAERAQ